MGPKEPTRHQLSSRLAYNSHTPAFLLRLQNQVAGRGTEDDDDEPQYVDGVDEFGRERRPPIPERPKEDERHSDDEDGGDERPMVVVLKEGKHLNEEEAENERRKAKGLPPLPPKPQVTITSSPTDSSTPHVVSSASSNPNTTGLSFSSTGAKGGKSSGAKRKLPDRSDNSSESKQIPKKKKLKKDIKGLLSFDDTI